MKSLLEVLGQNPQKSLRTFMVGFGLFLSGAGFIALGYYTHHYWQMLGIFILAIGCLISAYGYIGIFASRLNASLSKHKPKSDIKF